MSTPDARAVPPRPSSLLSPRQPHRLQERNLDGAFLLRMSATQAGVYTISLQAKGEIKHIRVTNTPSGNHSLGKSNQVLVS